MVKKASKRLISAILALIASVLLCIGVCLAWFAVNNDVRGDGLQTQINSNEVVGFNVTAYFLDYSSLNKTYSIVNGNLVNGKKDIIKDANGNVITVDYNEDKIINSDGNNKDVMRPFSLSGEYTTAVLFEIDYEILGSSENNFRIFAQCPDTSRIKVTPVDGSPNNFTSSLSNTVKFVQAQKSGDDYGALTGKQTFVNELYEKSFHISLFDGINANSLGDGKKNGSGNYADTKYVIMDYERDRFTYISSLLLESGGGLNSGLTLLGDITLGIEEYTNETVVPTSIAVDELARDYKTAYTQPMGTDVMSPKWQFVVIYSDGTKKLVCGQNANLSITNLNTNIVGKSTATATYTEGTSEPVSCQVDYTIGLVITGGTGVAKNDKLNLSVTGLGDGVTVTWLSLNTSIATINSEGVVTGVSEGTVTITATATGYKESDESTYYLKATYVVTVTAEKVAVTGVTLDKTSLSLEAGNTAVLSATITPADATNKAVTWSSSSESVATVSGGVVRAVGEGEATITVTTKEKDAQGNPYTATCTVTVAAAAVPVESVTISGDNTVNIGGTIKLTAEVTPDNATNKTVTWEVIPGTGSANITQDGVLTGVSAGTVTATADGVIDRYIVTVNPVAVESIELNNTTLTLDVGATATLTATINPDAAIQAITWTTSNATVATVENGKVTAVAAGSATITASAGGKSVTCAVTVNEVVQTYTYTFYNDDGTTELKTATINAGETIVAPNNPTKTATAQYTYTFGGWYTAASGGDKVTEFGAISENVSYYARFTSTLNKYTYTFYDSDGTTKLKTATVDYGTTIEAPADPTKSGYTFDGWYTDKTGGNKVTEFGTISGNVSYYAHWTAEITGYTANGEYTLDLSKDSTIFTVTKSTGDGGYNKTYVKLSSSSSTGKDYLYITINLPVGKLIKLSGSVIPANTAVSNLPVLGFAVTSSPTGAISGLTATKSLSSTGDTLDYSYTVTSEGTIIIELSRSSGGTGINITALTVTISDPATVESVAVTAANGATTVANGGTLQLTATVNGTNSPAQTVNWSIKNGATATGATVSNSGLLSAGTVAGTVTVVATSTVDNTKSGEITITVQEAAIGGEPQVHNFTTQGTTSSIFTITGSLSTSKGSVTYNGLTLTQCLKMETNTSISFTATAASTLTLVFVEAGKKVNVDGKSYTTDANGIVNVELSAGKHTITKGDAINLFYIVLETSQQSQQ